MPVFVNVNWNVFPGLIRLESNTSPETLSLGLPLVTVCATLSPFVQVTVVPVLTVSGFGAKQLFVPTHAVLALVPAPLVIVTLTNTGLTGAVMVMFPAMIG